MELETIGYKSLSNEFYRNKEGNKSLKLKDCIKFTVRNRKNSLFGISWNGHNENI